MLPPLGAAPTSNSNIADISGIYERISTKFSEISLLTTKSVLDEKMLKYIIPSWGNPTPII